MENELTKTGLKEGSLIWAAILLITLGMKQLEMGNPEIGGILVLVGTGLICLREYVKAN